MSTTVKLSCGHSRTYFPKNPSDAEPGRSTYCWDCKSLQVVLPPPKVGDTVKWYEELPSSHGPKAPHLCEGKVVEVLPLGVLVESEYGSPVYIKNNWLTE